MSEALDVIRFIWTHPSNRGRHVRAVARGVGWQLYKRLTGRSKDITVFERMRLRCYPDSPAASAFFYTHGGSDVDDMAFVRRYLRPGDEFLDVGANIGVYTLLAASVIGPEGFIDSFEPGAVAASRLRENVDLNGLRNVRVHESAVAETRGTIRFLQDRDLINRIVQQGDGEAGWAEVPCLPLDEFADRSYAMGKIDVEGAEPMAFRGALQMLAAANPPVWLMEMKDYLLAGFGFKPEEFAAWLVERGYDLAQYDAERNVLKFCERAWVGRENVLAIARSAKGFVAQRMGFSSL